MGIVESEAASFAQLKGAETVIAGIGGSKIGMDDGSEKGMVGKGGSVCMDIDAEVDWRVEGKFVEMEAAAMVGLIWIPTSTWEV